MMQTDCKFDCMQERRRNTGTFRVLNSRLSPEPHVKFAQNYEKIMATLEASSSSR